MNLKLSCTKTNRNWLWLIADKITDLIVFVTSLPISTWIYCNSLSLYPRNDFFLKKISIGNPYGWWLKPLCLDPYGWWLKRLTFPSFPTPGDGVAPTRKSSSKRPRNCWAVSSRWLGGHGPIPGGETTTRSSWGRGHLWHPVGISNSVFNGYLWQFSFLGVSMFIWVLLLWFRRDNLSSIRHSHQWLPYV